MFNQYFGFTSNPFGLAADFSFFKIDADKQAICTRMLRDLNNGFSRFLVTGVSGVGKSQLLRYLFTQLPPNTQSICLSGKTANYSDRIRFIIELTAENYQIGKKSLVVIDNAHEIPEDDLRLLFSLISQNNENVPVFPIIFCGLDSLEFKLDHLGFKPIIDDNCRRYHVSALDEQQVRDYINFRLHSVGYDVSCKQEIFSADVIKMITALSQGIPHSINLICGASLMIACLDNTWRVSEQVVQEAAMSCLLSPKNTNEIPVTGQFHDFLNRPINLLEQDHTEDLTKTLTQPKPLSSGVVLAAGLLAIAGLIIKKGIGLFCKLTTKQDILSKKSKLQKKFEIEVLSGIGICFLVFFCLLTFNWLDDLNKAFKSPYLPPIALQTTEVGNFTEQSRGLVQTKNVPFKSNKQTEDNLLKIDGKSSVNYQIANSDHVKQVKSNPNQVVSFATEKVIFSPISAQDIPTIDAQKTSLMNVSSQQIERHHEKRIPVVFVKPSLNFPDKPTRLKKKVNSNSFLLNRSTRNTAVVDAMEASARERSSNRLKLNILGIDYSVEALLRASRQGNLPALKLLLAGGIPPDIQEAVLGASPLLEGARNGQLQVVQALLAKGANANIRNHDGQTALITAVKNNKKDVVKVLLKKGADPTIFDRTGRSAFSYAVQTKNSEMVSLLSRN